MAVKFRTYNKENDFNKVSNFLIKLYQPNNRDGNWFQAIWEYSYSHPLTDTSSFGKIGIWEDNGEIIAVIIYDMFRTDLSLCIHPEYQFLKNEMIEYAESSMPAEDKNGISFLKIFASEYDIELEQLLKSKDYKRDIKCDRAMSQFLIPDPFPQPELPDGFKFRSIAENNDLKKIHRVLHRGFNHPGDPPENEIEGRKKMQASPNFRADLTMVVEAPNGDLATYCGMWYDKVNRFGYVEPVATDPDYRRKDLGRANVLESIRRCSLEGAEVAYVWTDMPFYLSFGFKKLYTHNCWKKYFD